MSSCQKTTCFHCCCSVVVQSCPAFCNPWTTACQALLCPTVFQSLLNFIFIESVMLFNHLILCSCLSFWLQSFPPLGSFPVSQLFTSGGQSIGISASVHPMNIQGWFPLGLTGLISLLCKGTHKRLLEHHSSKAFQMIFLLLNNPPAFANLYLQSYLFKIGTWLCCVSPEKPLDDF